MSSLSIAQPSHVYEFHGDGKVEEYHEHQLIAIITSQPTKEHIDAMFEVVEAIFKEWDSTKPILILLDATWGETTPHFRQRIMQLNAVAMTMPIGTRIAFLVQEDYADDLRLFSTLTGTGTNHRLSVFTDREKAVEWLEKELV